MCTGRLRALHSADGYGGGAEGQGNPGSGGFSSRDVAETTESEERKRSDIIEVTSLGENSFAERNASI